MSALADEPGHFVAYCQRIDPSLSLASALWSVSAKPVVENQVANPGLIELRVDEAAVLNRAIGESGESTWHVALASGEQSIANQVLLALGHQRPQFPISLDPEFSARLIDPWRFDDMHRLPNDRPVLIVGTGHTAVDALFCLTQSSRPGPIYMLARHGLLPHRHRLSTTAPTPQSFPEYLRDVPPTVRADTRALRQHLKALAQQGGDWRDALNELRPHSPQLWQSLPANEQRRFFRHLQAHWDVHHHRLAPMAAQRLDQLLAERRAQVIAGRITTLRQRSDGIEVAYRPRGSIHMRTLKVCAIVNCIGPSTDIQRHANPLIAQLLKEGWIAPDTHGLGLRVTLDLQVIDTHQNPVKGLWYVGPLLKAALWEATAVPELRLHTQHLAQTLLNLP